MRRAAKWFTIGVSAAAVCYCIAQELTVRSNGDYLRIAAPNFHFLTGKPLQRIQDGNAVAFDFQLTLSGDGKTSVLRRSFERFVISYDLWEERFSVTRMRSTQASASRLTAQAAEAWCMDNVRMAVSGLPSDRPVHLRLEVKAQNAKDAPSLLGENGLSLPGLVDIFSRSGAAPSQSTWKLEAGPLRIADITQPGGKAD